VQGPPQASAGPPPARSEAAGKSGTTRSTKGQEQDLGKEPEDFIGSTEFWKVWNQRRGTRKDCTDGPNCTCFEGVGSLF